MDRRAILPLFALLIFSQWFAGSVSHAESAPPNAMTHTDRCAMPMGTYEGTTFWPSPDVLAPEGKIRAALLFVEFRDYRSTQPVDEIASDIESFVHDWYERSSFGQVDIEFVSTDRWVEMPRVTGYYNYDYLVSPPETILGHAVRASDSSIDFSTIDFPIVVTPTQPSSGQFFGFTAPWDSQKTIAHADGRSYSSGVVVDGEHLMAPQPDLSILVHEIGHIFSLPDIYHIVREGNVSEYTTPVGIWDVMSEPNGGERIGELLAVHKWKLGWLDDDQVICIDKAGIYEIPVTPIEVAGGIKAVVVRTGLHTATVMEHRQPTELDSGICEDGILVYDLHSYWSINEGLPKVEVLSAQSDGSEFNCSSPRARYNLGNAPFDTDEGEVATFTHPGGAFSFQLLSKDADTIVMAVTRFTDLQLPPTVDAALFGIHPDFYLPNLYPGATNGPRFLTGYIGARPQLCVSSVELKFQRWEQESHAWRNVARTTTDVRGRFKLPAPKYAGRYRALIEERVIESFPNWRCPREIGMNGYYQGSVGKR